jgi:hypothetical protein
MEGFDVGSWYIVVRLKPEDTIIAAIARPHKVEDKYVGDSYWDDDPGFNQDLALAMPFETMDDAEEAIKNNKHEMTKRNISDNTMVTGAYIDVITQDELDRARIEREI